MANLNAPSGFSPVRNMHGNVYNGPANRYYKGTTAGILGTGDPVIRLTASSSPDGFPEVVRATTGSAITGVIVGIEYQVEKLSQSGYYAAADTGYLLVCDDPNMHFEVQEGGSSTALAVTNIGNCINSITAVNADTTRGLSKYQIDNGALSSGDTWRLERLVQRVDNAVGQYAKWIVSPSLHTEVNASAATLTNV
jgi:hypothetical protein